MLVEKFGIKSVDRGQIFIARRLQSGFSLPRSNPLYVHVYLFVCTCKCLTINFLTISTIAAQMDFNHETSNHVGFG